MEKVQVEPRSFVLVGPEEKELPESQEQLDGFILETGSEREEKASLPEGENPDHNL